MIASSVFSSFETSSNQWQAYFKRALQHRLLWGSLYLFLLLSIQQRTSLTNFSSSLFPSLHLLFLEICSPCSGVYKTILQLPVPQKRINTSPDLALEQTGLQSLTLEKILFQSSWSILLKASTLKENLNACPTHFAWTCCTTKRTQLSPRTTRFGHWRRHSSKAERPQWSFRS